MSKKTAKKNLVRAGVKTAIGIAVPVLAPALLASELLHLGAQAALGEGGEKTPAGRALKGVGKLMTGGVDLDDVIDHK